MRAYVVDDQRAIVELLTILLTDLGVEASGTTNPREALDEIAAAQPDLVLLDVLMPGIDGLELLDQLQTDARTRAVPVVLCTASALNPSQGRLVADKGVGVLSKPFDLAQLSEIVAQVRAE